MGGHPCHSFAPVLIDPLLQRIFKPIRLDRAKSALTMEEAGGPLLSGLFPTYSRSYPLWAPTHGHTQFIQTPTGKEESNRIGQRGGARWLKPV